MPRRRFRSTRLPHPGHAHTRAPAPRRTPPATTARPIRWRASTDARYAGPVRIAPCLLLLAAASTARADDSAARASQLFQEGRALAKAGKLAEACARFQESFDLDAETGTEVNLADCLEKTGKLRAAWHEFDTAAIVSLRAGNTTRAKFA